MKISPEKKGIITRFVKQTLFSLLGTATDISVLWFLSHVIFSGYTGQYIISPIISFECANVVNFFICSRWVWGERTKDYSKLSVFTHFLGFNLSYSSTFLLKLGLIQVIKFLLDWDVVWCNIIALMISGIVNFIMNEKVLFRAKRGGDPNSIKP